MDQLTLILMDGLVVASRVFLISAGLTVIYGVMRILNVAHGSLYALGAYTGSVLILRYLDVQDRLGLPAAGVYAAMLLAAVLVGVVAGPVLERGVLRWLYGHEPILQLLATFALFLMLEDFIKIAWGGRTYNPFQPYGLLGTFSFAGIVYPWYFVLLMVAAVIFGLLMWLFMNRSRFGRLMTAVAHDPEMGTAMGINLPKVYVVTFSLGAVLAALGGALTAPMQAVVPAIGGEIIVISFAVVVIGGLGSLPGAALGALLVGIAQAAMTHTYPQFSLFTIYLVMTVILLVRPYGLFAREEGRRI